MESLSSTSLWQLIEIKFKAFGSQLKSFTGSAVRYDSILETEMRNGGSYIRYYKELKISLVVFIQQINQPSIQAMPTHF